MNDDALPLSVRSIAIGVLIYVISPIDVIPDKIKALKLIGLIDDVVVMIIGLSIAVPLMPQDRLSHYRGKYQAVAEISGFDAIAERTV